MTPDRATTPSAGPGTPALILGATVTTALVLSAVEAVAFARGAQQVRDVLECAAYLGSAVAAWNAARVFRRGDHLRRAWHLLAVPPLLIVVLTAIPNGGPAPVQWLEALVTVVANGCGVVAMVQFASTLRQAGLVLPGTAWQKAGAGAVLFAAIALAVGPDVAAMAQLTVQGNVSAASALVADLCDVALVMLLVPVFFTARAFAGGSLGWPFAFLAGCELAWLFFDGFQTYKELLGLPPVTAEFVDTLLHLLAPLFVIAAALSQRLALRQVPVESA